MPTLSKFDEEGNARSATLTGKEALQYARRLGYEGPANGAAAYLFSARTNKGIANREGDANGLNRWHQLIKMVGKDVGNPMLSNKDLPLFGNELQALMAKKDPNAMALYDDIGKKATPQWRRTLGNAAPFIWTGGALGMAGAGAAAAAGGAAGSGTAPAAAGSVLDAAGGYGLNTGIGSGVGMANAGGGAVGGGGLGVGGGSVGVGMGTGTGFGGLGAGAGAVGGAGSLGVGGAGGGGSGFGLSAKDILSGIQTITGGGQQQTGGQGGQGQGNPMLQNILGVLTNLVGSNINQRDFRRILNQIASLNDPFNQEQRHPMIEQFTKLMTDPNYYQQTPYAQGQMNQLQGQFDANVAKYGPSGTQFINGYLKPAQDIMSKDFFQLGDLLGKSGGFFMQPGGVGAAGVLPGQYGNVGGNPVGGLGTVIENVFGKNGPLGNVNWGDIFKNNPMADGSGLPNMNPTGSTGGFGGDPFPQFS